ncbi:uncharacterized protein YciI [Luteimonas cucumeris]|uniref:Uncharacterized protein YciI n=1 Tax=Luteimonas cucumeris TaxID=985012 RepID=A0A562L8E3_9GAMM|nr:YciI family protein [Luteimonas cucumeris]TWI03855.1 uncharacterized protein YciI [Luteimonas cucumeris]
MKHAPSILLPLLLIASNAGAQQPATTPQPAQATASGIPAGMKQYWFVMLKKGVSRDQTPEVSRQLQAGHMANINAYAEAGKLQIAGPFMDDGDWRGIFILDVPDRAAAEKMCADDPAVKAGRLACEIHPWLSEPGATLK